MPHQPAPIPLGRLSQVFTNADEHEHLTLQQRVYGLAGLKAFLTGWVNVLTFMRYGCFGTMQTGNGILLARALAASEWDRALFFGTVMIFYLLGLVLYRALDLWLGHRSSGTAVAPIYFVVLCAVDLHSHVFGSSDWELCLVALAFGGMNSLAVKMSGVVVTREKPELRPNLARGAT